MKLEKGTTISHYKILSEIGKGGMGEVYLAQDANLNRKVAIKFLSEEFSKDSEKLNRFIQEAQATSALNHPNILTVYEIDEVDGKHYIATEFIEGETLRYALGKKESVPLNQILKIGIQTAEALSAAHNAGIAHRDIKPENIMIRADGYVKVLDFGLAKLTEKNKPEDDISLEGKTKALVNTNPGVVMGTVSYMSPEQARGKETDEKTDIWSLGVVLYEMLSGKVPFAGETLNHTIVAILETEPKLLENVPDELQRIVRKALTKEKENRYQTARDLLIDLKNLRRELDLQGEIERSIIPNKDLGTTDGNDTQVYANQSIEETDAPAQGPVTQNVTTTSSLEYAVIQARGHRLFSVAAVVVLLGAISAIGYFGFFSESATKIESIAVMPFVNESDDKDVEYLSDGMTETLISSLSNIPALSVKARSTVFFYKGKEVSPNKLGEELNVQAVLLGRVVNRGDDLKLSLELVDTRTQNVVWSENYNRRLENVLLLQAEITNNVFNELKLELSDSPDPGSVRGHTTNSEAYKEYLRGRFYWNKRTGPDIEKSIGFFQKAIELDPKYAKAWSALADSYILMPEYSQNPSKGFVVKAKSAAMKALEINPDLAEPHATLAYSFATYEQKFDEAVLKYKKAIGLDPGYATAHQWYGELLSNLERHDEAIREIDAAQELEPRSIIINFVKTSLLLQASRPDESIAMSNKILSEIPGDTFSYIQLATAYRQKGDKDRFIENVIKLNRIQGKDKKVIQGLKTAFERGGFTGYYRLRAKTFNGKNSPRWAAKFHLLAGDKEKAIEYLKIGVEKQQKSMLTIKADPDFDVLHDDPRFIELVKKLGFSNDVSEQPST